MRAEDEKPELQPSTDQQEAKAGDASLCGLDGARSAYNTGRVGSGSYLTLKWVRWRMATTRSRRGDFEATL